jgi:TraG P-loop domain
MTRLRELLTGQAAHQSRSRETDPADHGEPPPWHDSARVPGHRGGYRTDPPTTHRDHYRGRAAAGTHGIDPYASDDGSEHHATDYNADYSAGGSGVGELGRRCAVVGVAPRYLMIATQDGGRELVAVFAVSGYPAQASVAWLDPLLCYPGRLDVSIHVEPVDSTTAATRLRRQLARLESGRRRSADHGSLADPLIDAAAQDAHELAGRLARAETKLFRLGLYLTVRGATQPDGPSLADEVAAVAALCSSMLLDARPATWRQVAGWRACLPIGVDEVRVHRTMDTDSIAAMFPFSSPDLSPPDPVSPAAASGVWLGYNLGSSGLVHWDRFATAGTGGVHNHNSVVLGASGSGKSYLVKAEVLRSLYRGIDVMIIDAEDEYTRLVHAVGGTVIRLGAPGVSLNPLDLPIQPGGLDNPHRSGQSGGHAAQPGLLHAPADALCRQVLMVHTVIDTLIGEQNATARAVLDDAITTTYAHAGITEDPSTWTRPAPLLRDLSATLTDLSTPTERRGVTTEPSRTDTTGCPAGRVAEQLAAQLRPFSHGAYCGLFAAPSSTGHTGGAGAHLVSYSLRALPEELRAVATLMALDRIWRSVSDPARRRRRLITIDEAWLLLQHPGAARVLYRAAKSARKHWAGLTVATQDVGDVLSTELGRAVVTNAATQILLRQATQAIERVCEVFGLSGGEREFLLRAGQG